MIFLMCRITPRASFPSVFAAYQRLTLICATFVIQRGRKCLNSELNPRDILFDIPILILKSLTLIPQRFSYSTAYFGAFKNITSTNLRH